MNVSSPHLIRYAFLSLAAAIITIVLKSYAYWVTGSVGLLSDALESLINLVAALVAIMALSIASRPADKGHAFGHEKIEYFSSGAEGLMILVAAIGIMATAWNRLWALQAIAEIDVGVQVAAVAALVNLGVARGLIRAGKKHRSLILEADGKHLMTDVWTSLGVVGAVVCIPLIEYLGYGRWLILDPVIAFLVAINITWTGIGLLKRTFAGLMDASVDTADFNKTKSILDEFVAQEGIYFHALRTRYAGSRLFISVHILVPGEWTVKRGHDLLERIELRFEQEFGQIDIDTHLEPIEDIASWQHD